jgi:hypothetical protein
MFMRRVSSRWGAGGDGLEEFDNIARGVLEQDLLAARTRDDVVAKRNTGGPKPGNLGIDVVDDKMKAAPSAGSRLGPVRLGSRRGAVRPTEQ